MLVPIYMDTNMAAGNQQKILLQKREFISRRTQKRNNKYFILIQKLFR